MDPSSPTTPLSTIRWTDLRDRLLHSLEQGWVGGDPPGRRILIPLPEIEELCARERDASTTGEPGPRGVPAVIELDGALRPWAGIGSMQLLRDRVELGRADVQEPARHAAAAIWETVRGRLPSLPPISLDPSGDTPPFSGSVVIRIDGAARAGTYQRPATVDGPLVARVHAAIRAAGFTPVPRLDDPEATGERPAWVLGAGVSRRPDGTAAILFDDMKHASRILEALLGEPG